jgi:molybdopterin molybdotransferase
MNSVAEVDRVLAGVQLALAPEPCPLAACQGRVLAAPIQADRDLPPHDRVTMDGIALAAAALEGRAGAPLRVEGEVRAGQARASLRDCANGALRVMTGAVLPAGSDTVIRHEELRLGDGEVWLEPGVRVTPGQNVHRQGADAWAGATVLQPGRRISAADVAVLASVGCAQVPVGRRPRVAVISTGDELIDVGRPIAAHQIRRSNIYAVAAALGGLGYPVTADHLPDDPEQLAAGVGRALAAHDVLITTGAVSMGSADYLPEVFARLGVACYLHRVRQRPGKPLWIGGTDDRTDDGTGDRTEDRTGDRRGSGHGAGSGKRVFALPGNPNSVLVCLRRYVIPFLERAQGAAAPPVLHAALTEPVEFAPPLTLFLPVILEAAGASLQARPAPVRNSGDFLALAGTDGIVELDAGRTRFATGEVVPFHPWQLPPWTGAATAAAAAEQR